MKYLFPIFILILFNTCQIENKTENIAISPGFLNYTVRSGFPFRNTLLKAVKGDETAILQIIRFAYKTDDANAVEHGVIFSNLAVKLGDEKFLNFIKKQEPEYRELVAKMFETAIEYDQNLSNLNIRLKKTFEFLFEN